jgi:hypothetical protein
MLEKNGIDDRDAVYLWAFQGRRLFGKPSGINYAVSTFGTHAAFFGSVKIFRSSGTSIRVQSWKSSSCAHFNHCIRNTFAEIDITLYYAIVLY